MTQHDQVMLKMIWRNQANTLSGLKETNLAP